MDVTMAILASTALLAALATGQPVGPHHVGCNVNEMFNEHIHAQLAITVRGQNEPVPAGIGIVTILGGTPVCLYWLHTHDESGTIHVEAPGGSFTLADFFAVWGEPLSRTQVGDARGRVRAYVNGVPYKGAPQSIPLREGESIKLVVP